VDGQRAGRDDAWWLGSLALVVVMVPLALKATTISTLLGLLCGVCALALGVRSADEGRSPEIRVAGAAAALLATTTTAVAIAYWAARSF
jgi:hypothetical protein